MPYCCRIYGLNIAANLPIPGIPATEISSVDVTLHFGTLPEWLNDAGGVEPWFTSEHTDTSGNPLLEVGKLHSGEYFHFSYFDQTQFLIDRTGRNIWAIWPPDLTLEDTATYLLGPVMGFVVQLRGSISLHASAIVIADAAVALVGPAGAGKSTTAAAFAERGYRILAEDVVTLDDRGDTFLVLPAYPCIRLWPASVRALYGSDSALPKLTPTWDKCYLDLNQEGYQFSDDPIPLAAIYLLAERTDEPSAPFISEVPGPKALMSLIANTYTTHLMDRRSRARGFKLLSRVHAAIPVRQITAHTDPARIDELCCAIVTDISTRVPLDNALVVS
jgi:hypothetical protein